MKQKNRNHFPAAACLLAAFAVWTAALRVIDVRPIGPGGSAVGFAALNQVVHDLTGVHLSLYVITDWLGLVPLCIAAGFALLGLSQWIRRGHLLKVDRSILALGGFYITVLAVYVFFEQAVVNYRPVLIDGALEASYPSSTTMLVICVMSTACLQFHQRIRSAILNRCVTTAAAVFMIFMVIGRLVSGVHWFTDIVGGILLSAGLVMLYAGFTCQSPR